MIYSIVRSFSEAAREDFTTTTEKKKRRMTGRRHGGKELSEDKIYQ
jgi:hypothetical protein